MENFRDDYVTRLQPPRHGIARALLADVFLLIVVVVVGLMLNSVVA